jgi:2-hydroxychromene-2-carboxylate isomerase
MDMATGTYPADQPYIHRLTRLGVLAAEAGRGLPFLREVSAIIWGGEVDNWNESDHLADAARRAGLDPGELFSRVESEADRLHAIIEDNQVAQRAAGHYGVPMIAFNNEPFFGQDRMDTFRWRLEQQGLTPRKPA